MYNLWPLALFSTLATNCRPVSCVAIPSPMACWKSSLCIPLLSYKQYNLYNFMPLQFLSFLANWQKITLPLNFTITSSARRWLAERYHQQIWHSDYLKPCLTSCINIHSSSNVISFLSRLLVKFTNTQMRKKFNSPHDRNRKGHGTSGLLTCTLSMNQNKNEIRFFQCNIFR